MREAIARTCTRLGAGRPTPGNLVGRDVVLAMIDETGEPAGGTFRLDLDNVRANDRHAVALVVWTAERDGGSLAEAS